MLEGSADFNPGQLLSFLRNVKVTQLVKGMATSAEQWGFITGNDCIANKKNCEIWPIKRSSLKVTMIAMLSG